MSADPDTVWAWVVFKTTPELTRETVAVRLSEMAACEVLDATLQHEEVELLNDGQAEAMGALVDALVESSAWGDFERQDPSAWWIERHPTV